MNWSMCGADATTRAKIVLTALALASVMILIAHCARVREPIRVAAAVTLPARPAMSFVPRSPAHLSIEELARSRKSSVRNVGYAS